MSNISNSAQKKKKEDKRWKNFLTSMVEPFKVCYKYISDFFIWIMFVIVAGQMGTIINLVNRLWFQPDWTFAESIYHDSATGSFYTYALVMIASLIAPIFIRLKNKEKLKFPAISTMFCTILIFTMVFCALCYSNASQQIPLLNHEITKEGTYTLDVVQFVFFVLAIVFALYAFGLELMVKHKDHPELNDWMVYSQNEDSKIQNMTENASNTTTTTEGAAL